MPNNESHGVFISSAAVNGISSDHRKKLNFKTTSGTEHAGRVLEKTGRLENMGSVYHIGQKSSKYMAYQLKRAPLLGREQCAYSSDFCKKPEGDSTVNNQMAALYLTKSHGTMSFSGGEPTCGHSQYTEDFVKRSKEQLRSAKLPIQIQPELLHVGSGRSLVKQSYSQSAHQAPPKEMAGRRKPFEPLWTLEQPLHHSKDLLRTTHQVDFRGMQHQRRRLNRTSSAPGTFEPGKTF